MKNRNSLKSLLTVSAMVACNSSLFGIGFLNKKDLNVNHPKMYPTSFLFLGNEDTVEDLDYPWGLESEETFFSLLEKAKGNNNVSNNVKGSLKMSFLDTGNDYEALYYDPNTKVNDIVTKLPKGKSDAFQDEILEAHDSIQSIVTAIKNAIPVLKAKGFDCDKYIGNQLIQNVHFYKSCYFYRGFRESNAEVLFYYNNALLPNKTLSTVVLTNDKKYFYDKASGNSSCYYKCNDEKVSLDSDMFFVSTVGYGSKVTVVSIGESSVDIHQFKLHGWIDNLKFLDAWEEEKGYDLGFSEKASKRINRAIAKLQNTATKNYGFLPYLLADIKACKEGNKSIYDEIALCEEIYKKNSTSLKTELEEALKQLYISLCKAEEEEDKQEKVYTNTPGYVLETSLRPENEDFDDVPNPYAK